MRRVSVYIDGRNFAHLLEGFKLNPFSFNYRKFAEEVLCPRKQLDHIKYYGARFPQEISPEKHNRDDAYYKALEIHQKIIVKEARFRIDIVKGFKIPQEKGVDVRLATDLIFDSVYNCYDDAYILSGDTDLIPAVTEVKKQHRDKNIYCCVPKVLEIHKQTYDGSFPLFKSTAAKYIDPKVFPATVVTIGALKGKFAPVT